MLRAERISGISIHAPTWGATLRDGQSLSAFALFQSTHPRGVRPLSAQFRSGGQGISIHAPTWGATTMTCSGRVSEGYFNPRTHVGCDSVCLTALRRNFNFNPRTHVGCDSLVRYINGIINHFNPRTHVGCDSWPPQPHRRRFYFNPRTHVGCDSDRSSPGRLLRNFNPRTHVGCDRVFRTHPSKHNISIHAPTWGATVLLRF